MLDVEKELAGAVRHFWLTRATQHKQQGSATGRKDAGSRGAVTGGKNSGLPTAEIHVEKKNERLLPGYFRPSKKWD